MWVKVFIFIVATTPHLNKSEVLNDLILSLSLSHAAARARTHTHTHTTIKYWPF